MKLIINRKSWLRGEGEEESFLLRETDCKMCCLGIYLEALGAPKSALTGRASPHHVETSGAWPVLQKAPWLFREPNDEHEVPSLSATCQSLMEDNDALVEFFQDRELEEQSREESIRNHFKRVDVEVEFVDE